MAEPETLFERIETLLEVEGDPIRTSGRTVALRIGEDLVADSHARMNPEPAMPLELFFVAEDALPDDVVSLASGLVGEADRDDVAVTWIVLEEGPLTKAFFTDAESDRGEPLTISSGDGALCFEMFTPDQLLASRRARMTGGRRPIFEDAGNLNRRADWFLRRSGDE